MRIFGAFICVSLAAFSSLAVADQSLDGTWVDKEYLLVLNETQSPRAACLTGRPIAAICIDSMRSKITLSLNFNEIVSGHIKGFDQVSKRVAFSFPVAFNALKAIHMLDGTLRLEYDWFDKKGISREFTKISAEVVTEESDIELIAERYIADVLLAGHYHDSAGKPALITSREIAWHGTKFPYRVILGCVEFSPIDLIAEIATDGTTKALYGFVREGQTLQVYTYEADPHRIGKFLYEFVQAPPGKSSVPIREPAELERR